MTKDVLVTIRGLQFTSDANAEATEVITAGEYHFKNEKHYLIYEEAFEGTQEVGRNIIKIKQDYMELTRKGVNSVHMVFEKHKKNVTYYYTPFGSLLIGIDAHKVEIEELEHKIHIDVEYDLEINYEHVADCHIDMDITPREAGSFILAGEKAPSV